MARVERLHCADEQSLRPLVELSPHLTERAGRIYSVDKFDVPLDDNGIPERVRFLRQVLGTVATDHYWTGYLDIHHIAWPGADYRAVHASDEYDAGALYRGCASLKIRLPRQLHNYIHAVTLAPPVPPLDVMQQWRHEQNQIASLYDTIKLSSLGNLEIDDEEKDSRRYSSYMEKLEDMSDGQLGLMPAREHLSRLAIDDARQALRCLARIRGLTNARSSRRQFFSSVAA